MALCPLKSFESNHFPSAGHITFLYRVATLTPTVLFTIPCFLTRFEKWKGKKVIILVLLIDAISFGIGHAYQGMAGAVSAGLTGIIFGIIYLRKRSFIEAFTAHAFYDVIGISLGHMMMRADQN